jgi:hypothetical protein
VSPSLTLAPRPRTGPALRRSKLVIVRFGRGQQHDLGPPPAAEVVALRYVSDHAGGLEVVEPALHALSMRPHERRALGEPLRGSTPGHHWRQPHDELLDRRRVARGASRVSQPEQVPLDGVRTRLEAVIARRDAAAAASSTPEQRTDDQAPGLGRKRLARGPIPAATRNGAAR